MPELRGKVALITGASSGIGESTALHFASLGCWLSLTARSKANLERVAEACSQQGIPRDKVLVVPGDVSVEKDVADVVEKTVKHFGKLDILVNNAGITVQKSIQDASLEDFNRVWNTNFLGPLSMIRNAVPHLRQTKGGESGAVLHQQGSPGQPDALRCTRKCAIWCTCERNQPCSHQDAYNQTPSNEHGRPHKAVTRNDRSRARTGTSRRARRGGALYRLPGIRRCLLRYRHHDACRRGHAPPLQLAPSHTAAGKPEDSMRGLAKRHPQAHWWYEELKM
ncbi:uncharacterized protein [Dermacentor andersoni]|uniref:uncharacterized protein isoform X1 n=1 Tax=Dermacentor andersoni TaxID=34620 RepID=UPI003B3BA67D